jgi:hypothetical protein
MALPRLEGPARRIAVSSAVIRVLIAASVGVTISRYHVVVAHGGRLESGAVL